MHDIISFIIFVAALEILKNFTVIFPYDKVCIHEILYQ
jgi:hypothetical protein